MVGMTAEVVARCVCQFRHVGALDVMPAGSHGWQHSASTTGGGRRPGSHSGTAARYYLLVIITRLGGGIRGYGDPDARRRVRPLLRSNLTHYQFYVFTNKKLARRNMRDELYLGEQTLLYEIELPAPVEELEMADE